MALVIYNSFFIPLCSPKTYKDVFNSNITTFQSNCAECLYFSAFIEKIRERGREGGRESGREGEREGRKEVGKEEGSVRAILSHRLTPNKARNSVHQAICTE